MSVFFCETELHDFGLFFFFQAEDGIRDLYVTGVQTCALPISSGAPSVAGSRPDGSAMPTDAANPDGASRSARNWVSGPVSSAPSTTSPVEISDGFGAR